MKMLFSTLHPLCPDFLAHVLLTEGSLRIDWDSEIMSLEALV